MEDMEIIARLRAKKLCCAQIMVSMGLHLKDEQNDGLVTAAAGLCGGMHSGRICGALTGAAMLLAMFDGELARTELIPELSDWFEDEIALPFGGGDCAVISGDRGELRAARCPEIVERTYGEARRLLAESRQI